MEVAKLDEVVVDMFEGSVDGVNAGHQTPAHFRSTKSKHSNQISGTKSVCILCKLSVVSHLLF